MVALAFMLAASMRQSGDFFSYGTRAAQALRLNAQEVLQREPDLECPALAYRTGTRRVHRLDSKESET
jgi:hypothetical protein